MKRSNWLRLDNAAKLFPPTVSARDTKVFRFSCELLEAVRLEELQQALDRTMERFPLYRSVLKQGLFWYYLEESAIKPKVHPEHAPPCGPLYDRNRKTLLFSVSYYGRRINLEVFHALSDGSGALQFLRALVTQYLFLLHGGELSATPEMEDGASRAQRMDDSFQRYYERPPKGASAKARAAAQLSGPRLPENRLRIVEGLLSVRQVRAKAHEFGVTVTILLTAVLLAAINAELKAQDRRRPVVVTIPVNLRKYFPSASARNFFGTINVAHTFRDGQPDLGQLIQSVKDSFTNDLTRDALETRMNSFGALEHNTLARLTPLPIKDVLIRIANHYVEREKTAALSNIGRVEMPKALLPFIRLFDVFVSTDKLQACMCSFEDNLMVSFTSPLVSAEIPKNFFRTLSGWGMDVEITANQVDESEGKA